MLRPTEGDRLAVAFVAVVVLAAAAGASATLGFASDLDRSATAADAADQVTGSVTNASVVTDDGTHVALTVRLHNPSAHDLRLTGTYVRLSNASEPSLATGAASFDGTGAVHLAAGERRRVHYVLSVRADTARAVRAALASGPVTVSLSLSLRLGEVRVTGRVSDEVGGSS